MAKLHRIQEEIKKYFMGKKVNTRIISQEQLRELSIYKSLAIDTLRGMMRKIYPLCYKILQDNWNEIIHSYYEKYPSTSSVYNQAAKNFSVFLKDWDFRWKYREENYPKWLYELAEYEWVEVDLYNYYRDGYGGSKKDDDTLKSSKEELIRLTKAHKVYRFDYPISKIVEHLSSEKQVYNLSYFKKTKEKLLIFRDRTDHIRYFLLSDGSYYLIDKLRSGTNINELYKKFHRKFAITDADKQGTEEKLNDLLIKFTKEGILTSS
ncbi:MAG: putative DNA-binding domain-containing protein [Candidatus Caenarcaniphilales bacterium]|nr:putative DNA-binding domain-containing protein [Candidatus Caenarcaniphilales bacterium]